MKLKIKEPEGIFEKVLYGGIALAVLFFLIAYFVLPYYACAVVVAGADTMVVGILVLVLFLALLGFAVAYIPKRR